MDLEAEPLIRQKLKMEDEKILKVLVIGESETGKTTFCSHISQVPQLPKENKKIRKTNGCHFHLLSHIPELDKLLVNQAVKDIIRPRSPYLRNQYFIQLQDIAGDKNQRKYIPMYTKQNLHEFKAILFFFDLTNLKTLYNFYNWIQLLFQNKNNQMNYSCLWDIPFLIVGTKRDQVSDHQFYNIKGNVIRYLKSVFSCSDGENILFISNTYEDYHSKNQIELKMFELFLGELCIEYELKKRNLQQCQYKSYEQQNNSSTPQSQLNILQGNTDKPFSPQLTNNNSMYFNKNKSEYYQNSDLDQLPKSTRKFCLNPDFYLNKYMIYDNNTLWEDFKFKIISHYEQIIDKINVKKMFRYLCSRRKSQFNFNNTI